MSAGDANCDRDETPLCDCSAVRIPWCWLAIGAVLAAGACLCDQRVTDFLTAEAVRRGIENTLTIPGALALYVFVGAILAAFPNRRRLWAGFIVPVLASAAVIHGLKFIVGRARPRLDLGPATFKPLSLAADCDSFPSGSAAAAATISLLLAAYFPRGRWVFYVMAGLVGLERILHDWHFLSDVIAAYVIAALVVYACVRRLGRGYYRLDLPGVTQ